jgi:3-hydroxyisobutyrate dehydrogenase-like beta-hydroxyacid dehydrogenase
VSVVAVVGLGAMGSRVARRFLEAGHELHVWNRSAGKAAPLVEAGAAAAATPAEAAARAEVVLTMVADPAALRDVTEGEDGVAAGVGEGATVIEMSTVGPEAVRRLASVLGARSGLLDAPVLGSRSEAEEGTLKVFVGGPDELVERWTPLLSALGSPLHVGPLGSGAAAKLVANTTLVGTIGVLGEALALAAGLGIPREQAFEVLAATPLAGQAERRREAVESGEYPPRFALYLARKDAELVVAAARDASVDLRLTEAARTWLADAEEAGLGDRDYSAVLARILGRHP